MSDREDVVYDDVEEREEEFLIEEVEEQREDVVEEKDNEEPSSDDPEIVERAKKYGHLSKEEWIAQGRNPKEWKSPEEFDKTGKVIEQLYTLKKKVEQRDRELQAVIDYQKRTEERAYAQAKQDLEQRLAASKDDMDVDGVAHYTRELTRLQDSEQQSQVQYRQRAQQEAQQAFIERNQHWFNDRNPDLKQRALEIDAAIQKDINEGYLKPSSYEEISSMIEKRLQYEHPERVLGPTRSVRPNVSPGTSSVNKTAATKHHSLRNLSQEHRDTYNVYKRINPKITEADFIQKLKNDGEL